MQGSNRISAFQELKIFTVQYFHILLSDKKNLAVSLMFPFLAVIIEIAIAGEKMFVTFENTKSGCFVLVSAAIWGGLFNSIQTVVRERDNVKRDYVAGIRLRCYTLSRAMLQFVLCAIQSFILMFAFIGVSLVYGNSMEPSGLIFGSVMLEYYVTMLLLMYAADAMGLFISCFVRKTETANVLAPYILIVQLIFSGVLFTLDGMSKSISYLMISRWGMEGLGSTSDINDIQHAIAYDTPSLADTLDKAKAFKPDDMFTHEPEHLLKVWLILLIFILIFVIGGNLILHRVSKDTR